MTSILTALRGFWHAHRYYLSLVLPVGVLLIVMFSVLHYLPHHLYGKDWHKSSFVEH